MYHRFLEGALRAAFGDSPAVLLNGARQVGKSTLVQSLAVAEPETRYLTLDDSAVLSAALGDPQGFIEGFPGRVVLDEIQRAPELLLAIKRAIDRDRRPGRFLLTGSAHVLLVPRVADSLAGRLEILRLWPLSQGEVAGVRETLIDTLFASSLPELPPIVSERATLWGSVVGGGYPEARLRLDPERRARWFESYLTTILERDIRDFAELEGLVEIPRLLRLLATRAGGLINYAEMSRDIGLPATTLKRYLALLEHTFLVLRLNAWSTNLGKRLVKAPKLFLNDSGLTAHLLGALEEPAAGPPREVGRLLETFVITELAKAATWSRTRPDLYHFRSHDDAEVDLVLEARDGSLVGIEVKASTSIGRNDLKGLKLLRDELGPRFKAGALVHLGTEPIPLGDRLFALPVEALWRTT
jgi:uncharacterized protein